MKVAVPVWLGRISPVFDVARRLLLVEVHHGEITTRREHDLGRDRVRDLEWLGVDQLICGAISDYLEARLLAAGIEVIAEICGEVDDVLLALLDDRLTDIAFAMPGCGNRRRRSRDRSFQGRRRKSKRKGAR